MSAATTPALAGNQNGYFLGNGAALTGGAVTAIGDDAASLWYNPAGLVALTRATIDLSGSAYTLKIRDYPGILRGDMPDRPDDADPLLDLGATEFLTVPSAIAFARNLGPDLTLGFGLFVPFADRFTAASELEIREPTAHLDASVELEGDTTAYAAAVGLGWRAARELRLGATFAFYYQTAELVQTLLFGYESPDPAIPAKGNGAIVQEDEIDHVGMSLQLGAQWQFAKCWWLGAVVRSPIVQFYESLERRRFQLGADVAPDGTATVVSQFAPLRHSRFDASVYLNFGFTAALAWTPEDNTYLALELDLQPGSRDGDLEREFLWNVRLGGALAISREIQIGLGLFTDRSWEPRPEAAWRDRVHYYGAATGLYFETPLALAPGAKADSLVFTSTFGLRYALGIGDTVRAVADPSGVHTDPGLRRIDLKFHEISLHVGSGLRF